MECTSCFGSPRWETCSPEEAKEYHWCPVPQLQRNCHVGPGRWRVQIQRHSLFLFSSSDFQLLSTEGKDRRWVHSFSKPMSYYTGWSRSWQPDVHYFNAFALKTWLMKPYGRRMLTREERIANYRICRGRRMVGNAFGIMASRFRVLLTIMGQPPETVREIVLTCVVCHRVYWFVG